MLCTVVEKERNYVGQLHCYYWAFVATLGSSFRNSLNQTKLFCKPIPFTPALFSSLSGYKKIIRLHTLKNLAIYVH